ncbi:MAG TPA: ROK family transcriptional regulator, partial [Spirochaetia bacterium]|nr:ROK family transcriptional regulator [Spirochaetia bacterium]
MKMDFRKHDSHSEQANILRIVHRSRRITRRQIVDLTGFSQAKISIVINELKSRGLLAELEETSSSGGRKAKLLQLSSSSSHVIGVEMGGYEVKAALIDLAGNLLCSRKMPAPSDITNPDQVLKIIAEFIQDFRATACPAGSHPLGVGIALSGITDRATGECVYFRNQRAWEGYQVGRKMEERLHLPCIVDDSSRMMAVAEWLYGVCRGVDSFVLISIGMGTGCGIFVDGEIFRGTNGFGGELGHMVIKENGPRCVCGNFGCVESFISGYALERRLREALQDNVYTAMMHLEDRSAKEIVNHALQGDKLAYSIVTDAAEHLGIGIANVINIFN